PLPTCADLTLPLFPYTTLFRSEFAQRGLELSRAVALIVGNCRLQVRKPAVDVASGFENALLVHEIGDAADRHRCLLGAGIIAKLDRKSTRLNSSHVKISYAVFC